jgi:DNA-binding GntR family transcriptional regulator
MTPPGHLSRAMGKRGPKPETLQRVVEAMRCDIKSGQYTAASLGTMLEKNLAERYGVSRDTARKARAMVLSKIVENSNHRK